MGSRHPDARFLLQLIPLVLLAAPALFATEPPLVLAPPLDQPEATCGSALVVCGVTAPGAEVTLRVAGEVVARMTADDSGQFEFAALRLAEGATEVELSAATAAGVRRLKRVIHGDREAPSLQLEPPLDGPDPVVWPADLPDIRGLTEPGAIVVLAIGRTRSRSRAGRTGRFELAVPGELPEGEQRLVITAHDAAGNIARVERRATFDRRPPRLELASPLDQAEALVALPRLLLFGRTEPGAVLGVRLNDGPLTATPIDGDGGFVLFGLPLREGDNTLRLTAEGPRGSLTEVTRLICRDTHAPAIVLDPLEPGGWRTSAAEIGVSGRTDPDATVTVSSNGGTPQPALVGPDGRFVLSPLRLGEERNRLKIVAVDAAGNQAEVERLVIHDRRPPFVQLTTPGPVGYLETPELVLGGRTELGARLMLRNDEIERHTRADQYGNFRLSGAPLTDGLNLYVLSVADALGNTLVVPIHLLARVSPLLFEMREPFDGPSPTAEIVVRTFGEADAILSAHLDGRRLEGWEMAEPMGELVPLREAALSLGALSPGPHQLRVEAVSPTGLRKREILRRFHAPGYPRQVRLETAGEGNLRRVRLRVTDDWDQPVADETPLVIELPRGWQGASQPGRQGRFTLGTRGGEAELLLEPVAAASRGLVRVTAGRTTESRWLEP